MWVCSGVEQFFFFFNFVKTFCTNHKAIAEHMPTLKQWRGCEGEKLDHRNTWCVLYAGVFVCKSYIIFSFFVWLLLLFFTVNGDESKISLVNNKNAYKFDDDDVSTTWKWKFIKSREQREKEHQKWTENVKIKSRKIDSMP